MKEDNKIYNKEQIDYIKNASEHVNFLFGGRGHSKTYTIINQLQQDNNKLETNWKELKKFIEEEIEHNVDGVKSFSGYQCKIILDKMQEIESGKNE